MNLRQVVFWLIASVSLALTYSSSAQQQVQIKGPKSASPQFSGSTYGPITSSDTLWNIASLYKQRSGLDVYQIMQATYELNPEAFEQNNINLLRNGAILNLPSARYISRIDPQQALQRALQDDSNFKPGEGGEAAKVMPPEPSETVASKEDLSATKEVLEQRLTAIDEEQNRQFMAIRQQFAESISSVQSLLTENQKLYERLDSVNQDIDGLRTRVDEEIQLQMDQMLQMQNEMLALSREAEAQRKAEMEKSGFEWLSDPITIITSTIVLSFLLLGLFAKWMIGRKKTGVVSEEPVFENAEAPFMEQSSEMDDLADALTDELSGDLVDETEDDLFGEDDLLDDVLSEELQESLDEALDEELESFDDLGDEMLVPDANQETSDEDDLFESGDAVLEQGDLDNLFDEDEDLLAEIDDEIDSIDLSETDDLQDEDLEADDTELDSLLDEDDLDELLEAPGDGLPEDLENDIAPEVVDLEAPLDDDSEQPEISIDELLEEPQSAMPESIALDDSDGMSEEMLQQLDKEISSQNAELDKVTDDLLNEIEQLEQMGDMLIDDEEDEAQEELSEAPTQHGIQELSDLSEELIEELDEESDGAPNDLADELLAELRVSEEEGVDSTATETSSADSDEQVAAGSVEEADVVIEENAQDDLADELLAELGVSEEEDVESTATATSSADSDEQVAAGSDEEADVVIEENAQDDLADELLAELGVSEEEDVDSTATETSSADNDEQVVAGSDEEANVVDEENAQDDLADELLAELGVSEEEDVDSTTTETSSADSDELVAVGSDEEADVVDEENAQDDLADELLAELGVSEEEDVDSTATETSSADSDELVAVGSDEEADVVDEESLQDDSAEPVESEEPEEQSDIEDILQAAESEVEIAATETPEQEELTDQLPAEPDLNDTSEITAEEQDNDGQKDAEKSERVQDVEEQISATDSVESMPSEALETLDDSELEVELSDLEEGEPLEGDSADELLAELEQGDLPEQAATDLDIEDALLSEAVDLDVDPDSDESAEFPEELASEALTDSLDIPSISEDEFDQALEAFEKEELPTDDSENVQQENAEEPVALADTPDETLAKPDDSLPSMNDIESLTDFDDSELEKALESFDAEVEDESNFDISAEAAPEPADASAKSDDHALDDMPGLGDWLSDPDDEVLEELENTSFDEILEGIDEVSKEPAPTPVQDALLDNPDLDLEALLTEGESADNLEVDLTANESGETKEEDFLDVEALLNESIEAESTPHTEQDLDLDLALGDFTGVTGDVDVIDVDSDQGVGAKLDLARAYIEIDDTDAAKALLEEVITKGDNEQISEAKQVLDKLTS